MELTIEQIKANAYDSLRSLQYWEGVLANKVKPQPSKAEMNPIPSPDPNIVTPGGDPTGGKVE